MLLSMRQNLELERALDTLEEMKKENLVPGLLSYLSVFDMALHLREPAIASRVLEEAEKLETFREKDKLLYMQLLRSAAIQGHVRIRKRIFFSMYSLVLKKNICSIKL